MYDKSEKVSYSAQCQTPYKFVTRRIMSTQESAIMVDKATQTKRAHLQLPREHHDISLNDSLISLGSYIQTHRTQNGDQVMNSVILIVTVNVTRMLM